MKEVFTTGQVAKICNVTIRTVIKWFEAGKIEGYKIPASKDRRIPRESLLRFLREHKIPYDAAHFDLRPKVLVADDDREITELVSEAFEGDEDLEIHVAHGGYQAGFDTMRLRPSLLVLDYELGDTNAREVMDTIGGVPQLADTRIIIMTGYLEEPGIRRLESEGLRVVRKPFNVAELREEIRELVGLAQAARNP
jgi:two-component system, OmpR family, response regulator RpaA